jgi:hypothetical protein
MAQLVASGQLEGISEKDLKKIDFSGGIKVTVNQVSATEFGTKGGGDPTLADLLDTRINVLDENGKAPPQLKVGDRNDKKFGVSEVGVTLTLRAVQEPSSDEKEPPTE